MLTYRNQGRRQDKSHSRSGSPVRGGYKKGFVNTADNYEYFYDNSHTDGGRPPQ